jgi:TM2 domain-containing membrane protein YozV
MNEGAFGGLILIGLTCYFLPTIVAGVRDTANGTGGVFFVNLLLGWTVIGWFVSFIWACSGETSADARRKEQQHRELLAAITKNPKVLS